MSKDGYYGDFESAQDEERQRQAWEANQLPEVVPCPECENPMYETQEMCDNCEKEKELRASEEELNKKGK